MGNRINESKITRKGENIWIKNYEKYQLDASIMIYYHK